ncbi:MFS transporter [Lacibacterium aquatile]|uniref:MFS transporter n=1 Tax=Lacibacterium aquatile TaxID=1168082 RepID=A0ABW5DWC0_9PROT
MSFLNRFIDLRPLAANPDFRYLWIGTAAQLLGRRITAVAVLYQVWSLTGSSFWVGAVGVVQAAAMILFGLWGGSLADRLDRRYLVLWTTVGALLAAIALAVQALAGNQSLAIIFALSGIQIAAVALGGPARRAFIPRVLPTDQVTAGLALVQLASQIGSLVGPALAGLVIGAYGVEACYLLEALAFAVSLFGAFRLPRMQPEQAVERSGIVAGLRFLVGRPLLTGALLTDLAVTMLAMPMALFPAINAARFGDDPRTLGLLFSAVAVGGVGMAAFSGFFTRIASVGALQLLTAAGWGLALAGVALVSDLWSTLALLALAGAADTITVISRGTLLQTAIPDGYRGRIAAVEQVVGTAGSDLGNFRAGLMAGFLSPAGAMAAGGLMCVAAIGAIALAVPTLRRFRLPQ